MAARTARDDGELPALQRGGCSLRGVFEPLDQAAASACATHPSP